MRISKKAVAAVGVAALAAMALTACSGGGGGAATGTPIKVAAISDTKSFPEAAQVAKGYFARYNEQGGFNGRPIELTIVDAPTGDAAAAVAGATDSINNKDIVAMVGSSTFGECAINHAAYEKAGMVSYTGVGVDLFCFTTPNMAAANNGPFFDIYATAWNAVKDGAKAPCFVANYATPDAQFAYDTVVKNITEVTGVKWAAVKNIAQKPDNNYSAEVIAALGAKCDAMVFGGVHPVVAAMIGVLNEQGAADLPVYVQTSTYDGAFPKEPAVAAHKGKVSVPAELATQDDKANDDMNKLIADGYVTAGDTWSYSFMQTGYLAALSFITALGKVSGDITRESVTAASQADATWPLKNGMWGNEWAFGSGQTHQANSSVYLAEIAPGSGVWTSKGPWTQAADMKWTDIVLPQ